MLSVYGNIGLLRFLGSSIFVQLNMKMAFEIIDLYVFI